MPTMDEYAKAPAAERLKRLERTPDELATALRSQSEATLARRPDPKNWAAKEVACHLRDAEELFMRRIALIMAMDDPQLSFDPATPERCPALLSTTRIHPAVAHA